jgi:RalA-binding protein 1
VIASDALIADFVNPQERINELSQLIKALPLANYSLLRALTAHLILIVQNSSVNKMTMRNVGIVFSPTLGIPAGVFSLMLGEFNRVFNVDEGRGDGYEQQRQQERTPRQSNYQQTVNGGSADQQAWTTLAGACAAKPFPVHPETDE